MKTFLIRGLPASMQFDSWWMDGDPPRRAHTPDGDLTKRRGIERALLLAALILLADVLIWQVAPGLSLAVFGLCLLLAGLAMTQGRGWGGVVLGAVFFLPVVEQVQAISIGFFIAGVLLGGAWIGLGGWPGLRRLWRGGLRLLLLLPGQSIKDLRAAWPDISGAQPLPKSLRNLALGWALPVGAGLIFLSLMIRANPLIENWLQGLDPDHLPNAGRVFFWAGMALITWPYLVLAALRQRLMVPARPGVYGPRRLPAIINPDAIRRSLILFNLLFAVQTIMDAAYLWGGAALPDGMSYAEYAHRGAYPLLVTALLAGAFALIARPFTNEDRLLRLVLLIWVAQTVLLVISSLLRLDLYIEVYGLTRLRLAAAIWMGLVAGSLVMVIWQVVFRQTAAWLLARSVLLGLITLYACMFLSFDQMIARYNLNHRVEPDAWYICVLGPAALPEIERYDQRLGSDLCDGINWQPYPVINDWREWGFRDWRVLRSLAEINARGAPL